MQCIVGVIINCDLLFIWVDIYLYLVTANKFLTNFRPCLAPLIFSFFTNLSRGSAKQAASAAAYQFSCFSEYTKSSQQAEAAFHQLLR
jgi:hypothetical protein